MNAYFLLVACLQLSPTLTPVSPVTTWAPLIFIFALSALKEALDDIQRFRADKEANRRPYTVIRDHALIEDLASEELRVGDLVYIPDNGEFPCDMVLLASSEADGSCYVQTANLDGETDLKPRVALKETAGCRQTAELQRLMVEVQCATPNKHVYEFDAVMRVMGGAAGAAVPATGTPQETTVAPPLSPSSKDWLSLSAKQLLHQGTFLRNTEFIYGMVVYTGRQTKLGMNKQKPRTKWTKLDRRVDTVSRFVFLTQLVLVMIFGVTGNVFAGRMESAGTWWYLALGVDEPQGWTASLIIPIRMLLLM